MESKLKKFDITQVIQVFNHFAQKRCINHEYTFPYSVCLHGDCWKSEIGQPFLCADCSFDHANKHKEHGDPLKFHDIYNKQLFKDFDDLKTKRISKFEQKINELHLEIEEWTRCQFVELKKIFSSHLIDNLGAIKNMNKMLRDTALIELSFNYESKEKVKTYCTQIQKIQDLNLQKTEDDKMDEELNFKLENIKNNIKENVKNQVKELADYLIDSNKKSKSLKNEFAIQEAESKSISILVAEMPIVKNC